MTSTVVWVSPSATSFSCLCELCLERARTSGALFTDALTTATVRGELARDCEVSLVRCSAGHGIVVRRVQRPPGLVRRDERQLQL